MARSQAADANVGMSRGEQQRVPDGHHGILIAMENQRRLSKVRKRREAGGVLDELEIERNFAVFCVVEEGDQARLFSSGRALGTEAVQP